MKRRKPRAERKETDIRVRVTVAQKELLTAAAERESLSVSSWVRKVAVQTAQGKH